MMEQQKLHCVADGLLHPGRAGAHNHAIGYGCRAGRNQLGRFFHFNQTHPAAALDPDIGVIAIARYLDSDLIGQLSDPRYLNKIPALFHEFEETGVNAKLGYKHPGDLRRNYPKFYWSGVYPYLTDALHYLSLTQYGKQIRANLFANVFQVEHEVGQSS